jgi:glutathione S-transferase
MLLIGMLDSPFVRRVAVSMRLLGLSYEHGNWSVGRDLERIRQHNPVGRVPTLVLDDGEVLSESAAILDYLDQQAGQARALLPVNGIERRHAWQYMALAIGAAETARDQLYERLFRPAEKQHLPWLERRAMQMHSALAELERIAAARGVAQWLIGGHMTQADITATCCYTFINDSLPLAADAPYPSLRQLAARCEALPDFVATRTAWFAPGSQ